MKLQGKMTKALFFDVWLYIMVFAFFAPFFGNFGREIFMPLGKYYYVILMGVCVLNFLVRMFFYPSSIHNIFLTKGITRVIRFIMVVLVVGLIACVFLNQSLENFLFLIILSVCFAYFSLSKYRTNNLLTIRLLSNVLLVCMLVFSLIAKFDYFNPNTYAEVATVLFLFSTIGYNGSRAHKRLFIINIVIAIYIAEFQYGSETQLFSIGFFAILFLFRKQFIKNPISLRRLVVCLFVFITLFPILMYWLINYNIVTQDIFTSRGERWLLAINAIKEYGLFACGMDVLGAHNGFLDMCVKYTFIGAVVIIFLMMELYSYFCKTAAKGESTTVLLFSIMAIVFMNSVESIFVGLTDGFFLFILTGILISSCISKEHIKGEERVRYGKINCKKCSI